VVAHSLFGQVRPTCPKVLFAVRSATRIVDRLRVEDLNGSVFHMPAFILGATLAVSLSSLAPHAATSYMNLLIVDDHPLFGSGFVHALKQTYPGADVRAELTIEAGLELAARWPTLELVLIDYRLGHASGIAGLQQFGQRFPLVARVLISGDEDPTLVPRARAAGASGFLGKSMQMTDLLDALQRIREGEEFFGAPFARRAPLPGGQASPTARQLEVLALVAAGRQNKQIADDLGIAERTVKLHITALLDVTGARNRTHLLVRAQQLGLI
jgi:DNA-binding NarL/FixJ family response regulator